VVAATALAIAAFTMSFVLGRMTGVAPASRPTLHPLRAPTGGLVLPHLSKVPALPTLAEPAPKPKPVAARRRAASRPAARRQQSRPKRKPKPAASSAPTKQTPSRPPRKPVVIVGSG